MLYLVGVNILFKWPRVKHMWPVRLLLEMIIRLVPILERLVRHPAVERTIILVFSVSGPRRHGAMNAPLITESVLEWRVIAETVCMLPIPSSGPARALKQMVRVGVTLPVWLFPMVVLNVVTLRALMVLMTTF